MKTALVVDHDPRIRQQVAETLATCSFDKILEAQSGEQAVEVALEERPLLIVMDVTLPGLNGIEAAQKISKKAPAPIVLLTGTVDSETVEKARLAGVMGYVVKPFRSEQLLPTVDLAIHQFIELTALHEEIETLKRTIETRKLVERAKGMLIKSGLKEPEAYRKMQTIAMDKRKSLRDVAEAILLMEG